MTKPLNQPYRCAWWYYQASGSRVVATQPEHAALCDDDLYVQAVAWALRNSIPLTSGWPVIAPADA